MILDEATTLASSAASSMGADIGNSSSSSPTSSLRQFLLTAIFVAVFGYYVRKNDPQDRKKQEGDGETNSPTTGTSENDNDNTNNISPLLPHTANNGCTITAGLIFHPPMDVYIDPHQKKYYGSTKSDTLDRMKKRQRSSLRRRDVGTRGRRRESSSSGSCSGSMSSSGTLKAGDIAIDRGLGGSGRWSSGLLDGAAAENVNGGVGMGPTEEPGKKAIVAEIPDSSFLTSHMNGHEVTGFSGDGDLQKIERTVNDMMYIPRSVRPITPPPPPPQPPCSQIQQPQYPPPPPPPPSPRQRSPHKGMASRLPRLVTPYPSSSANTSLRPLQYSRDIQLPAAGSAQPQPSLPPPPLPPPPPPPPKHLTTPTPQIQETQKGSTSSTNSKLPRVVKVGYQCSNITTGDGGVATSAPSATPDSRLAPSPVPESEICGGGGNVLQRENLHCHPRSRSSREIVVGVGDRDACGIRGGAGGVGVGVGGGISGGNGGSLREESLRVAYLRQTYLAAVNGDCGGCGGCGDFGGAAAGGKGCTGPP